MRRAMHKVFTGLLLVVSQVLFIGCAHSRRPLELSASFVPSDSATTPQRLVIVVRNLSDQPQRVVLLTNWFAGVVYLREGGDRVRGFIHTNTFVTMICAHFDMTMRQLAPGGSCRFEHALSEFIDPEQRSDDAMFFRSAFAPNFEHGCEIWCALDVRYGPLFVQEEARRWANMDDWAFLKDRSGLLVSRSSQYPNMASEYGN